MARWMIVLAAGTALAGCAARTVPPAEVAPPMAEAIPVPPTPAPKAAIGTFGFDSTGMNPSAKPGDDFYEFANGTWARNTQIPADKSNWGSFAILQDLSQQRTRELLDAAKDNPDSKIGIAYSSFLDEAAVEAKGLAPIQPWLDEIRGLKSRSGYAALEARAARNGITGLFAGGVGQDDRHSEAYIVGLNQAGLGMPDRDM